MASIELGGKVFKIPDCEMGGDHGFYLWLMAGRISAMPNIITESKAICSDCNSEIKIVNQMEGTLSLSVSYTKSALEVRPRVALLGGNGLR